MKLSRAGGIFVCQFHTGLREKWPVAAVGRIDFTGMSTCFQQVRVIAEMSAVFKGNILFDEDRMEIPVGKPAAIKLL